MILLIVGTMGVLLFAKKHGYIDLVMPLIHKLRQQGYWLSDELVEYVQGIAGE